VQLASTVIYVDDVPEAMRFYVDAFGFAIGFLDTDVQFPGRVPGKVYQFGELRPPGGILQFATPPLGALLMPGFPAGDATRSLELAFYTDEVPTRFRRAVDAGARSLRAPETMPWGQTVAYLQSPDGTYLALCTPPDPRAKDA
jgi:lactoylglutathione lyase